MSEITIDYLRTFIGREIEPPITKSAGCDIRMSKIIIDAKRNNKKLKIIGVEIEMNFPVFVCSQRPSKIVTGDYFTFQDVLETNPDLINESTSFYDLIQN